MLRSSNQKCQANADGSQLPGTTVERNAHLSKLRPSTTVPLTLQVLKPTMPLHDLPPRLRRRRKPGEETHKGKVYLFAQARGVS